MKDLIMMLSEIQVKYNLSPDDQNRVSELLKQERAKLCLETQ